ncbi:hypothetical protein [Bradyrhizobium sp. CCGB01]|uniref:hypothetical protein n=1 Tax=Bradyrhizobium sp. CCGB01 TaxID=2949634 RepID=UPI0020B1DDC7|nr:hypothetical protein [Bradyrhizobium sp. CCGB01]MCP3405451.1 hypothetical protein [Bradyrhizobium sp. CCGB01]
MSTIALWYKAVKLMKLCDLEGFQSLDDHLLVVALKDSACPAFCITGGDHTANMEPDLDRGFCEACGGNTVVSVLVLAGLI